MSVALAVALAVVFTIEMFAAVVLTNVTLYLMMITGSARMVSLLGERELAFTVSSNERVRISELMFKLKDNSTGFRLSSVKPSTGFELLG